MKNLKAYKLAKLIAQTLNAINHNTFTATEIKEAIQDYIYLLNNDKQSILNVIKDEINNGNNELTALHTAILNY